MLSRATSAFTTGRFSRLGFSGKMSRLFLLPTMKVVLRRIIFVSLSHASAHRLFLATTSSSFTGTRGACVAAPCTDSFATDPGPGSPPIWPTGATSPAMDAARDPTAEPT